MTGARTRSWWGWGYQGEGFSNTDVDALGALLAAQGGLISPGRADPPPLGRVEIRAPRLAAPGPGRDGLWSADPRDRIRHGLGCAYRDVVRALGGRIDHPPDLVARPSTEAEVVEVLDWCSRAGAAVVPFGGGTSVVGGVEPDVGDGFAGAVSLDLGRLSGVLEVDRISQAARIAGGTLGPDLEDGLRRHDLTLRHFPQSFECSTLGGWIATRAGGHFATGPTHIDDLVEALRVVTPAGVIETRRLPASGAGPSPDRLFIGSEGALGVITEAWVRARPRPRWRAGGTVHMADFPAGLEAVRLVAQSGLQPANCRLVDPMESLLTGTGDGSSALLLIGFESADHPVEATLGWAAEIVRQCGGVLGPDWGRRRTAERTGDEEGGAGAEAWRRSFLRAPYLRDALVRLGLLTETFETAVTWDRVAELHAEVSEAVLEGMSRAGVGGGMVTCRVTHAYPDGAAPYFTVLGVPTPGSELAQWDEVKRSASETLLRCGGTITHHHAVGRVHMPWYRRQRPALVGEGLAALKGVVDPDGICNPGVLVDRPGPGRR